MNDSRMRNAAPDWLVPTIIGAAVLMQTLSATVVINALPAMAVSLGVTPASANGAITTYLLAVALFLPLTGWMADRFGARRVFMAAICVYAITSALAGMATSLEQLLLARFFQGAGSSAILPVGRVILLRTRPKNEFTNALAIVSMAALQGPFLGPMLGGALVTFAGWRWIFFLNLPIALLGFGLAYRHLPDSRIEASPIDIRGLLLLSGGFSALVFGFQGLGRNPHQELWWSGLMAGGGLFLLGYLIHARSKTDAVIAMEIFRHASCRGAVLGGSFFRVGVAAFPLMLTILLQVSLHMSAFTAGAAMGAIGAGAILTKFWVVRLLQHFGFRKLVMGCSTMAATLIIAAPLVARTFSLPFVIALLLASGVVQSIVMTCLNTLAYADIEPRQMGAASTAVGMTQQFGMAMGVGSAAALLTLTGGFGKGNDILLFSFCAVVMLLSALWFATLPAAVGSGLIAERGVRDDASR